MTILTYQTDRKTMVKAISEHLGIPAEYMKMPTRDYQIGDFTVHADGSVECPKGDETAAGDMMAFLREHGFIGDGEQPADLEAADVADRNEDADTAAAIEIEPEDFDEEERPDCDGLDEYEQAFDSEAPEDDKPTGIDIIIHNHGLDGRGLINLMRMVYSRQQLIRKMTRTEDLALDEEMVTRMQEEKAESAEDVLRIFHDCLRYDMTQGITLTAENFGFRLAYDENDPTRWQFGSILMNAMVNKCKELQRVNVKPQQPAEEEMKYFARAWLMQLGLGGAEYAAFRHAMLDHLKGYAAFRTASEMEAHNAKYAAQRKQSKASMPSDLEAQRETRSESPSENAAEEDAQ